MSRVINDIGYTNSEGIRTGRRVSLMTGYTNTEGIRTVCRV